MATIEYGSLSEPALRAAERQLSQACPVMARLIPTHGPCRLAASEFRPFHTLVRSIIRQQLSMKAADTIEGRVLQVLPSFSPAGFLSTSFDALRTAGLSSAKTRCVLDLSARVHDGRIDFDRLTQQPDDDVIAALTQVPGIGRWTAEMFLIFSLRRPDVLSLTDAGLQRAVRLLYGDGAELGVVGQIWRPYRSVASWYLWRHLS